MSQAMWMREGQGQYGKKKEQYHKLKKYLSSTLSLGEYQAFKLAQRSFYNEVCLIQSSFKEEQFLTVAKQTLDF